MNSPITRSLDPRARRLRRLSLHPALADRAADLTSDGYAQTTADEFVRFFECLHRAARLTAFKNWDLTEFLASDAERDAAEAAIKQALPRFTHRDDTDVLTATLFRLSDLPAEDRSVSEFVRSGVEQVLGERTGSFQSRAKHFNAHDARDALLDCKRVFDEAGQRFFLDRGTLLGCVREGGFIASDYDIDVGIFADEIALEQVKQLFANTDFTLTQDFEYKVGVRSSTGVQIDFFLTTRERGFFLSKGYRSIHHWYFTPFELMEYPFLGERFLIPATYEKHLDENYGNWRDPAIFYDLSYDEPCVAYGPGPAAFTYLAKRLAEALRDGSRFYSDAAATALARRFSLDVLQQLPTEVAATVTPRTSPKWRPSPIVFVDEFKRYTPWHRRVIESALSITPDVRLCVLPGPTGQPVADRLTVARNIDRITVFSTAATVSDDANSRLDIEELLADHPIAVIANVDSADEFTADDLVAMRVVGCELLLVDSTIASLDLVDGRIAGRSSQASSAPR